MPREVKTKRTTVVSDDACVYSRGWTLESAETVNGWIKQPIPSPRTAKISTNQEDDVVKVASASCQVERPSKTRPGKSTTRGPKRSTTRPPTIVTPEKRLIGKETKLDERLFAASGNTQFNADKHGKQAETTNECHKHRWRTPARDAGIGERVQHCRKTCSS